LQQALGAAALHLAGHSRIFGLERLADLLGQLEVDRGVQTTLPSFLAASISAGVTALGGGAADSTRVENDAPAASAPEPINTSRREILEPFIAILPELAFVV
jgi:hypothetical protein